jgi:molecular chaperone GrpE
MDHPEKTTTTPAEDLEESDTNQETVDYQALYQRALADQENARKRAATEKEQFAKFAQMTAALDLLPIVDNFSRALDHVPEDQKNNPWITGVLYIQKQLLDVLEGWGVNEQPVKPGDRFDPNHHDALANEESSEVPEDHIIRIQSKGYTMHDRVIRSAQVVVATSTQTK